MERETERENQHGQLQPLWGSSQAFSMENSNRAAAAAGSEKKWKIWIRQFDNVQAARELIKNAPALRGKLGIERVARYRHYLIAVFPNIHTNSRQFFSPSKPVRYFPLIICHVSMQISIHWLRTADIGYFRQLKIENCQLEFARSRLSNPPRKVANCSAHPPCQCHPFFHHPYPHIFSRYFLLNFYGNLQWTRRAFGIVAVIPGPTQFLMANNCQKVVRATRCGVRRCGVGFPARKFACSVCSAIGIVMRLARICEKWKMQFTWHRDGSRDVRGCFPPPIPPIREFLQHLPNSVCKFKRCGH